MQSRKIAAPRDQSAMCSIELEEGRLRPLDVVEDHDERPLERFLLQDVPRRDRGLGRRRHPEHRLGVRVQLEQHLDERPVRDALAVVEAATSDDARAAVDVAHELRDEPRLPDAGRPEQREEL